MRIIISTATWYDDDKDLVQQFEAEAIAAARNSVVVFVPADGDLKRELATADVFFPLSGRTLTPELIAAAPNLRWVHLASAGVEHAMFPELREGDITLTNAAGVYAIPIAEHVVAMMLAINRAVPQMVRQQDERRWTEVRGEELYGSTALVVGLGGIGRRVARCCRGLGMSVIATRRRPENPDPDADQVYGADALGDVAGMADWLILCAPHNAENRHLIDASVLERMKPGARIVNIARGSLVDETALVAALESGRLRAAALDVFEAEPLPEDSPFWGMPNVFVSPHTSGSSPHSLRRTLDLFLDNLRRFLDGEPLLNVVDKDRGY